MLDYVWKQVPRALGLNLKDRSFEWQGLSKNYMTVKIGHNAILLEVKKALFFVITIHRLNLLVDVNALVAHVTIKVELSAWLTELPNPPAYIIS